MSNQGSVPQDEELLETLRNSLPETAWDHLKRRNPAFTTLLWKVLSREIKAESPAFRVAMCSAGPGGHPSSWMDWTNVRAGVSASITQIEAKVGQYVKAGKSITLRDLFPIHSFYLLAKSSFDEFMEDTNRRYQGDALTNQFAIWKEGINNLMDSIEVGENDSVENWVLGQVAVLDWNSALVDGPFSRLPPPLPHGYNDALWRRYDGKTHASLVMTPAGHLSYCHADDNLAGFEIITIHGYKAWFIWDSTPECILKQQAQLDQGLNLRDFNWCLEELGIPVVYITTPGTGFIGYPGYIHAVFSFTPSAHWAIAMVSEKMRPRTMELLPIWKDWLHNHQEYINCSAKEQVQTNVAHLPIHFPMIFHRPMKKMSWVKL